MFTPVFSDRRRAFRMTKLCSNRFECITRMLPRDVEVVAEIGYDHGEILLRAAKKLPPPARIIGVEKQIGAADRFRSRNAHNPWAQRIELRCGSGLTALADDELHTLVLAGLGEARVCDILGADPQRLCMVRDILCMPLQRQGQLAELLRGQGFAVYAEDTAIERGRYYPLTHFRNSLRA